MAKAVKKTTKAATPVAETKVEAVVEVKEEVKATPVAEVKEEVKKAPAKKATTKKATEVKAEVKEEKAPAKKAAAKKTAVKANVTLQFADKSYTEESLVAIAKDVWTYDLNEKEADLKTVELYVKPEEGLCYYVFNGDVTGSFVI